MKSEKLGIVDIKKCVHPRETSRFWLALLVVLPITILFIVFTVGLGLLILPIILFLAWFAVRVFRAHLLGSCAEISPDNFPEVYEMLEHIRSYLDYPKKVEAYAFQNGDVNTFLIRRFRTRIILLPHELLAETLEGKRQIELIYLLSRAVGHLKAKHLKIWWLNLLVESFEKLFVLNLFLYPWERATQYSGDRIGLAVCSDLEAAIVAMNKLMLGNKLAEKTTLIGALKQRQRLKGTFFGWIAEAFSTHPHLTNRIESLISWSKNYNPDLYESFLNSRSNRKQIESLLQLTRGRSEDFPVLEAKRPASLHEEAEIKKVLHD